MQALFYTGERSAPLHWHEVATPELVEPTDALVRPIAVAACDLDRHIVAGRSPFPGPFMLGHEFTGEIVALGEAVTGLDIGDRVLASFQPSCGECGPCSHQHSSVCGSVPNGTMYGIGAVGGDWQGALADLIRVPWATFNLAKVPSHIDLRAIASAADNLADGLRGVEQPLQQRPGTSVLVAGSGSIPLYAVLCAMFLGAEDVTLASDDEFALGVADAMGATCLPITTWPKRFRSHGISVDCTNDVAGLAAVIGSTSPYGICTSSSIFFGGGVTVPMFNMNMRGIAFHTGRVNSASNLDKVLALLAAGLNPEQVQPAYFAFEEVAEGLHQEPFSRKVIAYSAAYDAQ